METLRRYGLYDNTLIAIAADHGEAFGEHGEERHGMFLYDETIHVPLLIKLPARQFASRRVEERVALADIAPSLLDVAGIPVPAAMQARSFVSLVSRMDAGGAASGDASKSARPIYSETNYAHRTFRWAELHSWRAGRYLYVQAPERELYDQSSDPLSLSNTATASKAIADTLQVQLADFLQKTSSENPEETKLDPSQAEKLRALGYAASDSAGAKASGKTTIDPKSKIAIATEYLRALTEIELENDHYANAIADLRDVIRQEPDLAIAYVDLGSALVDRSQYPEALKMLRIATGKTPDSSLTHYELGLLLIKTGQWDAALVEMQTVLALSPKSALAHLNLALIQTRLKHLPEAEAEYAKTLEIDPDSFQANMGLGQLLLHEGHPDLSLPRLSRAAKVNPVAPDPHTSLAEAYEALGQAQNASEERAKASQLKSRPPE